MRAASLLLLASGWLFGQQAAVEGVVVNAATGQPLSGVHVRLTGAGGSIAYGAMSDRAGRYSIAAMKPGAYVVFLRRTGFVHLPAKGGGGPSLTLKPGQLVLDHRLEMTPRAVIAGRVVDEYGDPVENAQVEGIAAPKEGDGASLYGTTNDRGEFRLRGAPGKYLIKATPQGGWGGFSTSEVRAGGAAEPVYGVTYYPSALSADRAFPVEATAGGDITGIDVRLARRRSLSISGVVRGPEGAPFRFVAMESIDANRRATGWRSSVARQDGKFVFPNLEPGSYRLHAEERSGQTHLQSPAVDISLDTADVTNVELVLAPGGELTGTLDVAGAMRERFLAERRKVRLSNRQNMFGGAKVEGGEVDKDGAFRLSNVSPNRYRVYVDPLPENAYLKTVDVDGAVNSSGILDLSRGVRSSRIKIVVGLNGGRLSGTVQDAEGNPIVDSMASVCLAEDLDEIGEENFTRTGEDGKYSFNAIRPGKYRLFAADQFLHRGGDPAALKQLAARGETIEIKEGDRIRKDLKVVRSEGADDQKR